MFAGSFQTTLARSEADQAKHRIGGDITLGGTSFIGRTAEERIATLHAVDGVEAVSPVIREGVGFIDGPTQRGSVLGVDPLTIHQTSWWRDDFADGEPAPLDALMAPLRRTIVPLEAGVALPDDADRVGIWVRRDDGENLGSAVPLPTYRLWMRIGNDRGFYRNLELGTLAPFQDGASRDDGWRQLIASFPEESITASADDRWRVVAVFLSGDSFARTPPGGLSFDDVTAYGSGLPATGEVVEGFEEVGPWEALPQGGNVPDRLERNPEAARTGDNGLSIIWEEPLGRSPRGIVIPPGPLPLPAVAGPGFTPGQLVRFTVDGYIVPAQVTSTVNHYPTLDSRRSFLVVSVHELRAWLKPGAGRTANHARRMVVRLDRGRRPRSRRRCNIRRGIPPLLPEGPGRCGGPGHPQPVGRRRVGRPHRHRTGRVGPGGGSRFVRPCRSGSP